MGALTFFLIAGEPSGDKLGAALMAGLRQLHPAVTFAGIGGPLMQAQGMTSLFPMEELSVMVTIRAGRTRYLATPVVELMRLGGGDSRNP